MKTQFYTIFILLMLAGAVEAQEIKGIAGFIQSGYMNAPNAAKAFNQVFPQNSSGFANNYFLIGAEGFYRKNKNVFMGDWQFGLQKVYSFNNEYAGAVYEAVTGKYGRVIAEKKNVWIYPSAGAGVSVISLTSYKKINDRRENVNTQTLVSPGFDISMNTDFLLSKLTWKENYYTGWMLGIKAGYRVSLKSNNWKNDNNSDFYKISKVPSYANNAFYVALSFGIGSFEKK
jgi:hypothetical protein